jgi:hypothetical protein
MALYFSGKSTCALCGEVIQKDQGVIGYPAFLRPTHRLWKYSDAVFHAACHEDWPDRAEFEALYREFKDEWDKRPGVPGGMSFAEFEATEPYKEFARKMEEFSNRRCS